MAVSLKLETEVKPKFIEVDVSVPASSSTTVEVLPDAGEVVEVRFIGIYFYTGATGSIVRIYDWSGKVIISSGSDSNITVIWGPDQPSQYIMDDSHGVKIYLKNTSSDYDRTGYIRISGVLR